MTKGNILDDISKYLNIILEDSALSRGVLVDIDRARLYIDSARFKLLAEKNDKALN